MIVDQVLRQLQSLLRSATWSDSPSNVVFATESVIITTGFDATQLGEARYPFCTIAPGTSEPGSDENPIFKKHQVVVTIVVRHEGDRYGEFALVGGQRTATTGSSGNRGLLEVEERILNAIAQLGPLNGETYYLVATSDAAPEEFGADGHHVVRRSYTFEFFLNNTRSYPTAYNAGGSVAGGTVTFTWIDPPSRFDLLNVMVRRIAGSSPPTTTTGTLVGNVALGAQTKSDTPAAGTWTYAVWGAFDETGNGVQERFSDVAAYKTFTV